MIRRKGRNCVCGRWVPSFATTCIDCGRPQNLLLLYRLAGFFSGESGPRSQRPAATRKGRMRVEAVP
jgi:hypothetical protein